MLDPPQFEGQAMASTVSRHAATLLSLGFKTFSPTELLEKAGPIRLELDIPDEILEESEAPEVRDFYVPKTECFVAITLDPDLSFTIAYDELGGAWGLRGKAVDLEALGFVNALLGVQRQ